MRKKYVEFLRFAGLTFAALRLAAAKGRRRAVRPLRTSTSAAAPAGCLQRAGRDFLHRKCAIAPSKTARSSTSAATPWRSSMAAPAIASCGNEISDMGAGGVKLNGSDAAGPVLRRTGNNRVTDNHIHHGGNVFHSAAGILSIHSSGNTFSHNHIHDLYYTGISCGWVWGLRGQRLAQQSYREESHSRHRARSVERYGRGLHAGGTAGNG